jgi:CO/xanthine dehydrogenase Mo-binding subunit
VIPGGAKDLHFATRFRSFACLEPCSQVELVEAASYDRRAHHRQSVPRKEGRDKVTGAARYIDDMSMPGMLYGATVRSQIPRGLIRNISFDPQVDWSDFVSVTAKDIPGKNCIALIGDDQPCLANERVNHPEEPILLLAHP